MKKRNKIIYGSLLVILIVMGIGLSQKRNDATTEVEKQKFFIVTQPVGKDAG